MAGAFSQSGKLFLAGAKDNYISMWNLENGQLLKFFPAHESDVNFVTFINNDNLFMTGCFDGKFKIWKTEGGKIAEQQDVLVGSVEKKKKDQMDNDIQEEDNQIAEASLLQQPELSKLLVSQSKNTLVELAISEKQLHKGEVHASVIGMKKPVLITAQQT